MENQTQVSNYQEDAAATTVFCPYRVSPLGAHVDHQQGLVMGLAIDKGVHITYWPLEEAKVEVRSLNFEGEKTFNITGLSHMKCGDWADHLRGVVYVLSDKYSLKKGLRAVIKGDLPSGGISSSAAVILAFMDAVCRINEIELSDQEKILLAQRVENVYVGVNCGVLDQSCEVLCKKGRLLYLDTKDSSYQLLDVSEEKQPYRIGIFFSGLERSLANSSYNLRVDECKSAAYALQAFAGMEYGTYAATRLRDVPREVYDTYGEKLPELWKRRAEHYFTEVERVQKGAELWQKGDLEAFGQLMFESGQSSISNYECGCPELIRMYEILKNTDGVYGARFSGAGFKGCCVALYDPEKESGIAAQVEAEYLKSFPELRGKYAFFSCESADGVGK